MQHGSPSLMHFKWAVRFAASHENVMLVLSRMSNLEHLRDNISYMENFIPFTEEEYISVKKRQISSTALQYHVLGVLTVLASARRILPSQSTSRSILQTCGSWKTMPGPRRQCYTAIFSEQSGKAGDCIGCGQCEKMCPQHIHIREWLKTVATRFAQT